MDVRGCKLRRNSDTYFPSNQSLGLVVPVDGVSDISSGKVASNALLLQRDLGFLGNPANPIKWWTWDGLVYIDHLVGKLKPAG